MFKLEPYDTNIVSLLEKGLNLPSLIARILAIRGIKTTNEAERFLYPQVGHLSDPFLLPDIQSGINAVIEAIKTNRKIGLYGDYDADGITSTALMANFLKALHVEPEIYIPTRNEGYGLNPSGIRTLRERGVALLICLDCGSTNIAEIQLAGKLGMEVVVIDHHEAPEPYPAARALINPKRNGALFPTRELAACGVTFFFLLALRRVLTHEGLLHYPINLKRELDLVTVGTVADMVPLVKDNRLLVKLGMEAMQTKPRTWLKSFFRQRLVLSGKIDQYALSFIIIPRINAAGRVGDPTVAFHFLMEKDEEKSLTFLDTLNKTNKRRQGMEEEVINRATVLMEVGEMSGKSSLVLYQEDWPIGVIGIAAQKLAEGHGKPCICFTRSDGMWRGSARGVPGLDLHGTVSSLSGILLRFGGHRHACGLSISDENLSHFPAAFENAVKKALVGVERTVTVDAVVDFDDLSGDLVELLDLLSPFGIGNPRPSLLFSPTAVSGNNRFVRLTDQKKRVWHGYMQRKSAVPDSADLKVVACPGIREERGQKFIHFHIREFIDS